MPEGKRGVVGPDQGGVLIRGGFGVVLKLSGTETAGAYSVVEHPLEPRVLAAPPHAHANEDEVSYVAEGRVGVWIDGEETIAETGSYVVKPRGIPHTFWNAGGEPARIVEVISPAGFEGYFEELGGMLAGGGEPDFGRITQLAERYGLTFHPEWMERIMARHGLELR
jgi:quercetin dioxygenase-like cupin family protein